MSDKILAKELIVPSLKTDSYQRQAIPDILKVLSILAVVFIHGSGLISYSPTTFDISPASMQLASRGLRFCVPVFIFLWAYFMEKSAIKRGNESVLPKFYKLFIPYFFWSIIYFLILADFKHLGFSAVITKHFSGYGWSGQYYFIILFQLVLLFSLISKFSRTFIRYTPLIFVCSVIFYIALSYTGWFNVNAINKIRDRVFIYWLPYVIFGIIYAHKNIFAFQLPVYAGLLFLAIIPAEVYWIHPQEVTYYLIPSVFIATLTLLSSLERKISYQSMPPVLSRTINMIAKHTMGIFCLNPLVYITLLPVFKSMNAFLQFPGASLLTPLFSTILITGICLLIINLLKNMRLGLIVAN